MANINKDKAYGNTMLMTVTSDKEARFMFQDYKHYPRLSVFVRERNGKPKQGAKPAVTFGIKKSHMIGLSKKLQELSKFKEDKEFGYGLKSPVWENDVRTEEVKISGKIFVGKKKIGEDIIYYLKVTNAAGASFTFKFVPTPYEEFYLNGEKLSTTEASKDIAENYGKLLEMIISKFFEATEGEVTKEEFVKEKVIVKGKNDNSMSLDDF